MPNRIHVLDPDVSAQIAAGEVVERPASVVKELIENALDAEAMHILIEVEAGGRQLIRVTDDGHGMSPEDAVLAFQRHATSKIRTAEDLQRILTFGFRGEALPSIAAVSHVELITREPDRDEGTKVVVDGGVVTELSTVGCPVGTSVSVRRLFYNVPARLKFMRSPTTEMNHIVDIVSKFILANPHVSFTLRHHGRDIIHHSGDATRGDMRAALITVWGRDVAREMVPIELSVPRIHIYGFVSKPSLTKSARTHQVFFVNRRWVRHHALSSAVTHAYRGMIPAERQPVCVIYIDIEPLLVDVNVHPTKIEVRFANQAEIQRLLVQAIQQALSAVQLTPTITSQPQVMKPTVASPKPSRGAKEREREELEAFRRLLRQKVDGVATPQETLPAGVQPAERVAASVDEHRIETASRGAPGADESPSQDVKAPKAVPPQHQVASEFPETILPTLITATSKLPPLRPIAQLHRTYILAEGPDGLYIISQHRAHERIIYERLCMKRTGEQIKQGLVMPFTITLGQAEAKFVEENIDAFREAGFDIEPFGSNTFIVRAIPTTLMHEQYVEVLRDIIDELMLEQSARVIENRVMELHATVACKSAIKAGETLSKAEMEQLLHDLSQTENPLLCPHGQPIVIALTNEELNKRFERS